jgi:hypothetical protein
MNIQAACENDVGAIVALHTPQSLAMSSELFCHTAVTKLTSLQSIILSFCSTTQSYYRTKHTHQTLDSKPVSMTNIMLSSSGILLRTFDGWCQCSHCGMRVACQAAAAELRHRNRH